MGVMGNPLDCRKAGDLGTATLKSFSLRKLPEGETSRKPRRKAPGSFTIYPNLDLVLTHR